VKDEANAVLVSRRSRGGACGHDSGARLESPAADSNDVALRRRYSTTQERQDVLIGKAAD
jgi:hypothetical protein